MRKRIFLNKPSEHSVAAIFAEVKRGQYTLKLSDCDHTVTFAIEGYDEEQRVNSLRKLDLIIKTVSEFRVALAKDFERKKTSD